MLILAHSLCLSNKYENTSRPFEGQQKTTDTVVTNRWEYFDGDIYDILGSTCTRTGDVHRKLSSLSTIVYAVGQERFRMSETRDMTKGTNKPNWRQQEIKRLRTKINLPLRSIRKQARCRKKDWEVKINTEEEKKQSSNNSENKEIEEGKGKGERNVCSYIIKVYKSNTWWY